MNEFIKTILSAVVGAVVVIALAYVVSEITSAQNRALVEQIETEIASN
jgi:hypothetical protein